MNQTHIIDSWIAELKMGARRGRVAGIRSSAEGVRRVQAIDRARAARPLVRRLGGDRQAVPQIAPCLGG